MRKRNKKGQFRHVPKMSGLYLMIASTAISMGAHLYGKIEAYEPAPTVLVSPLTEDQLSELRAPKQVEVVQVAVATITPTPEPKTEKEKIKAYLKLKFGERYEDGLKMLETCENSTLNPRIVSPMNIQKSGRKSYDVGVMQINVDAHNTAEIERLKDYKYNIDRGYEKFKAKNNTFYAWTCGHVAGDRTYADNFKK